MKTEILKINAQNPEKDRIEYASDFLKKGGTIAFPTETVYGLGANALDSRAVSKIFEAKGRPGDNPLIIHISNIYELDKLVREIPEALELLASKFWPGPLTIIMKKSDIIPSIITAGLDTVAIRIPSHPIARSLIKAAGIPVAAPSANISGKPSPTIAKHVIDDLYGKVDIIIDGGPTQVGLESTVIDISDDIPMLLRPGAITIEQIRDILGRAEIAEDISKTIESQTIPRSPGMKYSHYSPDAQVVIIEGNKKDVIRVINEKVKTDKMGGLVTGVMALDETVGLYNADHILSVGSEYSPASIASNLFYILRKFDELGVDIIYAQSINEQGIGMAIKNRMNKAAGYNIINV